MIIFGGCVLLFQAPFSSDNKYYDEDYVKYYDSNTVNVISNTALCNPKFEYGRIDMLCIQDHRANVIQDFTYFKDIVRRSIIVMPPKNSMRIKNQRGCFILCNCNKVTSVSNVSGLSSNELTNMFINDEDKLNLCRAREHDSRFKNVYQWDIEFEKIEPYSKENEFKEFRDDPFDINRLLYKKRGKQVVIFIPPEKKQSIIDELEYLNITDSFIYPEMDTVSNDINNLYMRKSY